MKLSDKIRLKMQTALDKQKAILAAAEKDDNRALTDAETVEFDAETKAYESAEVELKRVEAMEAREADMKAREKAAKTDSTGRIDRVTQPSPAPGGAPFMFGQRELDGIERVGVAVWAAAKAKEYPSKTPFEWLDDAGLKTVADECRATRDWMRTNKAWLTTGATTGQNVIETPLSNDFIAWLGNSSAFLAGQPVPVDLSYGSLDISGGNGRSSGSYTAEGADIPYTEATTRKINLSAKHLRALTAIGNHAIEVSPLAIASLVGQELALSVTLSMDSAGLRGDGLSNNPAGLLSLINAAHKFAAANATAPTLAQVDADAKSALSKLATSNIPKVRRRWMMAARVKYYLQFLRDGNGNYVFPGLHGDNPTWVENIPVIVSEQIPTNLGAGTNESEIYLVDFGHVLMGTTRALTLKASTEASYKNSGGTLVSSFSLDETVIRATGSHDFDVRYDKCGVVLTAVKWGA